MSVPTDKRDESDVLFKTIPQELYNEMAPRFAKMLGRYKDAYYTPILQYLLDTIDKVNYANILSIEHNYEERFKLLHLSRHNMAMIAKLLDGVIQNCNARPNGKKFIPAGTQRDWFTKIEKEINLLGGVIDADRVRHEKSVCENE